MQTKTIPEGSNPRAKVRPRAAKQEERFMALILRNPTKRATCFVK